MTWAKKQADGQVSWGDRITGPGFTLTSAADQPADGWEWFDTLADMALALGSGWATLATAITDGFIDGTGTTPRTFNAGANVWVGSERDAAQWFNGDIAEILRFNRALTPTETNQVGAYLAARYRAVWVGV